MSKDVFIAGSFDCLDMKQIHLIKEAKKLTIPDGNLFALLLGDYTQFMLDGKFPVQPFGMRKKNLEYFLKPENIEKIDTSNYLEALEGRLKIIPKEITYVHYITDKDFEGRELFKKYGIKIKFIKERKALKNQL